MEFFDFTGANDVEKAQALDVIERESTGVEFYLEYNTINAYANSNINSNTNHNKPSYANNSNGILSPPNVRNGGPQQQQQQQRPEGATSFNYSRMSNVNQAISSSSSPTFTASQSNWDQNTNSALLAMPPTGASQPVVCAAPPYIYQQAAAPYFAAAAGPHNPSSMYPVPQMAMTAHSAHSLVNHQNTIKETMKPARMPSNSSSHIISSSSTLKNSSKNATTNVPNCDIQSSFYMPSHHYTEAPQLVANGRLSASGISVSGDGGAIISEPGAMATNGSSIGVPHHMTHHPHQHPYGHYPHHAFQHPATAAALYPGHFPQSAVPVYFIPHPDTGTYPYYTHFPAPNMSLQASAHPQNVITSPNSSQLDLAQQSNQHSSNIGASASSSATTTLSNLSSSVSASTTSIAAAYHSSEGSQSGTPTSFDQTDESNPNILYTYDANETAVNDMNINEDALSPHNQQPLVYENEHVPLPSNHSLPCQSPLQFSANIPSDIHSTSFPSCESPTETETSNKKNVQFTSSTQSDTDSMNQFLSALNIKYSNSSNEVVKANNDTTETTSNTSTIAPALSSPAPSTPVVNTEAMPSTQSGEANTLTESPDLRASTQDSSLFVSNAISSTVQSETTDKTPTSTSWASKLFGSVTSEPGHKATPSASRSKQTMVNGGDIDSKSSMTNGDFPELSAIKPSVHSQPNSRTHKNRHAVEDVSKLAVISMIEDPVALKLAKRLRDTIHLKHSLPTIMPCGLINHGNWCYVNATLQALLACPPFYNLMREISETNNIFRQATSTPIIDNFARYFGRFLPTDYKRQMKSAGPSATSYLEELLNNDPFEPTCIYDTLKHIGMIKNDAQRGHQEDAEEFLSSVLNGLHEEMIKLSNALSEAENGQKERGSSKTNGFGVHDLADNDGLFTEDDISDPNDNIWHEVGTSKHKALPTRSAKVISTAITEIFGGSTLDVRTVSNSKDNNSTGNRQPFFALQLDIKPPNIKNLEDALHWQTRRESIQGYTCSKTKQVVEAHNQMFLETVPPILILHLKLFDYDIETGAGRKVLKRIEFGENFEIPRDCFLGNKDSRQSCKKYKLLAVVYHNGSEAMKGHYITDVYHLGLNQWLRCDDGNLKVISISQVLAISGSGTMVPYLLFYRRQDTLNSTPSNTITAVASNVNGGAKVKQVDLSAAHNANHAHIHHQHQQHQPSNSHRQPQQHAEVAINTSNKFSFISRHNH